MLLLRDKGELSIPDTAVDEARAGKVSSAFFSTVLISVGVPYFAFFGDGPSDWMGVIREVSSVAELTICRSSFADSAEVVVSKARFVGVRGFLRFRKRGQCKSCGYMRTKDFRNALSSSLYIVF